MKRTLQFNRTADGYACFENGASVFEILKSDLQFNVKEFYHAFYDEGKDFEDIEIEYSIDEVDSEAKRVYDCITTLLKRIGEKLTELNESTSDSLDEGNSE